jgi:hypothetical protein
MTISAEMQGHETRRDYGAMPAQAASRVSFLLAGVVVGAMLLRLGLVLALPRVVWRDEVDYLLLGRNLLNGQGFTNLDGSPHLVFPPGFPFVVGTIARLVGDLEWASNLVYVLCGGLLLLSIFVIARRLYGTSTAWLGVLLVAVCPALNVRVLYWGSMTEPLYTCLVYGGLATLLVGLEDQRWGLLQTAGLLFGLAYLIRPEALGTSPCRYLSFSHGSCTATAGCCGRRAGPSEAAWWPSPSWPSRMCGICTRTQGNGC